jgi:hypothetical protein
VNRTVTQIKALKRKTQEHQVQASMEETIDKNHQSTRTEPLTLQRQRKISRRSAQLSALMLFSAIIVPQTIIISFIMYWFYING